MRIRGSRQAVPNLTRSRAMYRGGIWRFLWRLLLDTSSDEGRVELNGLWDDADGIRIKAVFVDTDLVPAFDSKVGDLVHNPIEAKLVHQVNFVPIRKIRISANARTAGLRLDLVWSQGV